MLSCLLDLQIVERIIANPSLYLPRLRFDLVYFSMLERTRILVLSDSLFRTTFVTYSG